MGRLFSRNCFSLLSIFNCFKCCKKYFKSNSWALVTLNDVCDPMSTSVRCMRPLGFRVSLIVPVAISRSCTRMYALRIATKSPPVTRRAISYKLYDNDYDENKEMMHMKLDTAPIQTLGAKFFSTYFLHKFTWRLPKAAVCHLRHHLIYPRRNYIFTCCPTMTSSTRKRLTMSQGLEDMRGLFKFNLSRSTSNLLRESSGSLKFNNGNDTNNNTNEENELMYDVLSDVPLEIYSYVFSFLYPGDVLRCSNVCLDWKGCIEAQASLWVQSFFNEWSVLSLMMADPRAVLLENEKDCALYQHLCVEWEKLNKESAADGKYAREIALHMHTFLRPTAGKSPAPKAIGLRPTRKTPFVLAQQIYSRDSHHNPLLFMRSVSGHFPHVQPTGSSAPLPQATYSLSFVCTAKYSHPLYLHYMHPHLDINNTTGVTTTTTTSSSASASASASASVSASSPDGDCGWRWSPDLHNWMTCNTTRVRGGILDGEETSPVNITLLHSLQESKTIPHIFCSTRPLSSDQAPSPFTRVVILADSLPTLPAQCRMTDIMLFELVQGRPEWTNMGPEASEWRTYVADPNKPIQQDWI
eukprot:TRINITY_DN2596_c0_g1_i5.p1 TRINITY_DN2596_c0_g1~~TRINITY_DN2596_c0_g1_i5.p1  ORF type:complete len:581 (+),score=95.76 TRINITY_DN2596_c0_g1_i5:492-2234(+)